jgi:hypothetical protein
VQGGEHAEQVGLAAAGRELPDRAGRQPQAPDQQVGARRLDRHRRRGVGHDGELRVERRRQRVADHAHERGGRVEQPQVAGVPGVDDAVAQRRLDPGHDGQRVGAALEVDRPDGGHRGRGPVVARHDRQLGDAGEVAGDRLRRRGEHRLAGGGVQAGPGVAAGVGGGHRPDRTDGRPPGQPLTRRWQDRCARWRSPSPRADTVSPPSCSERDFRARTVAFACT